MYINTHKNKHSAKSSGTVEFNYWKGLREASVKTGH